MGAPHGPGSVVELLVELLDEVLDTVTVVDPPPTVELVDDDELVDVEVDDSVVVVAPHDTQHGSAGAAATLGGGEITNPGWKTGGMLR
jgi:hypothetical protein